MSVRKLRLLGDSILKERAEEVTEINGDLANLGADMIDSMRQTQGLGVAAPQVGVGRRMFVYTDRHQEHTVINPTIVESRGEWLHAEGCLSIPHVFWKVVRPREVHLIGWDLDGEEVSIEATDLLGRLFQHEVDHLDGLLLTRLLNEDQQQGAWIETTPMRKSLRKALMREFEEQRRLNGQPI